MHRYKMFYGWGFGIGGDQSGWYIQIGKWTWTTVDMSELKWPEIPSVP